MRNLKKVLSLTLALVMMLGMMTFAGAAEVTKVTSKDMTDMATVENKEAVSLLIDLGIINGVKAADGTYTFNPKGNIERGAYAKMVYAVMMGSDNADVYKGVNTGLKDVKGHWAEGFIGYCVSTKIAAGNGNGTFTPNANITVVAGAKMLLVGLGYDAKLSGYENDPLWSINIMRDAQAAGLLEGIGQAAGDTMTRDTAAQMIFNALVANTVRPDFQMDMGVKYLNGYLPVLDKNKDVVTLASRNFNLKTFTGVVAANDFGAVAGATQDAGKTLLYTYVKGVVTADTTKLSVATGVDMLGKEVRYYTYGNKNVDSSFVAATGKTKTYTYNDPDIANATKFLDNNGITVAGTAFYSNNYDVVNKAFTLTAEEAPVLMDSNADGIVDFVTKATYTFSKVTKVDATNITITGLGTRKVADVSGVTGLVKGDYVNYTTVGTSGKAAVTKAAEVVGTVTAKKADGKAVVGGTAYTFAKAGNATVTAPAEAGDSYLTGLKDLSKAVAGIFYLNQAGAVAVYMPTEAAAASTVLYAYVTALNATTSFGTVTIEAKVVLADGTQTTLKVVDTDAKSDSSLYKMATVDKAVLKDLAGVYPYTLDKDGAMVAGAKIAATTTSGAYVAGKPTMALAAGGPALLNANTVVLFYTKAENADAKISSVKGVENIPGIADKVEVVLAKGDDGFATFLFVGSEGIITSTAKYAYALSKEYSAQTSKGYEYDMVVDGAKVTLTTAKTVDTMHVGSIYTYTLGKDDIATMTAVEDTYIASGVIKSVSSKYIVIGTAAIELGADYTVDDLTATTNKGAIVPANGDLTADSTIIYVTSAADGGKLLKAYVINANGNAAFKENTTTHANEGTALSVDGYNLTIAGTFTSTGNHVSLEFTAPAGVSAISATDGTLKYKATATGSFSNEAKITKPADNETTVAVTFDFPAGGATAASYYEVVINWTANFAETYIIDTTGLNVYKAPAGV